VVGTHFPDKRDEFESALQRMREAFEGLRDGQVSSWMAEYEFRSGYAIVQEIASMFFLARQTSPNWESATTTEDEE
jgi:hypothetical protein